MPHPTSASAHGRGAAKERTQAVDDTSGEVSLHGLVLSVRSISMLQFVAFFLYLPHDWSLRLPNPYHQEERPNEGDWYVPRLHAVLSSDA